MTLGNFSTPSVLLAIFGILLTIAFVVKKVPAAVFVGMVITAIVGIICGACGIEGMPALPSSILETNLKLDGFGAFASGFGELFADPFQAFIALFSFLFVDFFDTAGTLAVSYTHLDVYKRQEELWWHSPLKYANQVTTPTLFIHSNDCLLYTSKQNVI